jgi:hypothetical protein
MCESEDEPPNMEVSVPMPADGVSVMSENNPPQGLIIDPSSDINSVSSTGIYGSSEVKVEAAVEVSSVEGSYGGT